MEQYSLTMLVPSARLREHRLGMRGYNRFVAERMTDKYFSRTYDESAALRRVDIGIQQPRRLPARKLAGGWVKIVVDIAARSLRICFEKSRFVCRGTLSEFSFD
jgi:hypothetical protein